MTKETRNFLFTALGIVVAMVAGLAVGYGYATEKAEQAAARSTEVEFVTPEDLVSLRIEELKLLESHLQVLYDTHKKIQDDFEKIEKTPGNTTSIVNVKFYSVINTVRLIGSLSFVQTELRKRAEVNK